ncbi:MAG: peptide chain release factor 1 [Thermodesulfobacteriota bacterium]
MSFTDQINKLLEFRDDKYPITSIYLKLGPNERENFKYRIILKNLIKEQREALTKSGLNKESIESVNSDFKRILDLIEINSNITACRGVAIFSCTGADFFDVFKLPLVYRSRLVVGRSPLTRQLFRINDEFGDIAVILIDRKKAKLFRITLNRAEEILGYLSPESERTTKFQSQEGTYRQRVSTSAGGEGVAQGYGEYSFQRMIENEVHQHFKNVSDKLFNYYKENKFRWLIIGGPEQLRVDFSNHLHTYLRERELGTITVDVDFVKPDVIVEEALDLLERMRLERQKRLLEEFEEKLGTRLAFNGLEPTLRALMRGQVRILLVSDGFNKEGYRCPDSGVLTLEEREGLCPEGVKPVRVIDIVDEAIEEALGQKAEVEIVADQELRKKIQGIGAILRYMS